MSKRVILYTSSVSANTIVNKNTIAFRNLLAANKIDYEDVDISLDENVDHKKLMIEKSQSEQKTLTPQLFIDGEYVTDYPTINDLNEFGEAGPIFERCR